MYTYSRCLWHYLPTQYIYNQHSIHKNTGPVCLEQYTPFLEYFKELSGILNASRVESGKPQQLYHIHSHSDRTPPTHTS